MSPLIPDPNWYESYWMSHPPRPPKRHKIIEIVCVAATSALAIAAVTLLAHGAAHAV